MTYYISYYKICNVLKKWMFGNEYQNFCKNIYETIMENLAVGC